MRTAATPRSCEQVRCRPRRRASDRMGSAPRRSTRRAGVDRHAACLPTHAASPHGRRGWRGARCLGGRVRAMPWLRPVPKAPHERAARCLAARAAPRRRDASAELAVRRLPRFPLRSGRGKSARTATVRGRPPRSRWRASRQRPRATTGPRPAHTGTVRQRRPRWQSGSPRDNLRVARRANRSRRVAQRRWPPARVARAHPQSAGTASPCRSE